jgi:hypothetical protein
MQARRRRLSRRRRLLFRRLLGLCQLLSQSAGANGPYAEAPWLKEALTEIGFHEIANNQGISSYIAMAQCGV